MKKIILIIVIVIIILFVVFSLFVNHVSNEYTKKIEKIEETFLKTNKDVKIIDIYPYNGTKTYYIVDYQKEDSEYIAILNYSGTVAKETLKNKLCELDKDVKLGYEDLKIIYEEIKYAKKKITYIYYDAYECQKINEITLEK